MNKTQKAFGVLATAAVALTAASAQTTTANNCMSFGTNLKLGMRHEEVRKLQQVLNSNPATQIAASGVGSKGMETNYFGPATFKAVVKFQELNAATALTPAGLTKGTGFVGSLSRAALSKASCGTTSVVTTPVTNVYSVAQPTGYVITGQAGARLAEVTVAGNGVITAVTMQRGGVSSNDLLTNVYLYDGATRVSDGASVNTSGVINFTGLNISVSGSKNLTVRADIASSSTFVGQAISVALTSATINGVVTPMTFVGPTLSVASVNASSLSVTNNSNNQTSGSPLTVNAGTLNQVLHTSTLNVGTRDASLKSVAYKYVGSAAMSSVANLSLYVDGVKVATGGVNPMTSYVTFDLNSTPVLLKTGNRVLELRGDVVGGSDRYFQFSIENKADLMVEDSTLPGVSVSNNVSNFKGTYISVKTGNLVISQDPSFTQTTVVGASANMEVARFVVTAYGETTKIETLAVKFENGTGAVTNSTDYSTASLQNVTLYANGGQIGSTQNWTSTNNPMIFNLGSSLTLNPGQSVTLTVKADMRNTSGTDVTSGSNLVKIVSGSSLARAQSSQATVTVPAADGKSLTVNTASTSVSKTAGFVNQTVSPNIANVKIGSITVQASDSEDIDVTNVTATVTLGGSAVSADANLITNLRVSASGNSYTTLSSTSATDYNFSMSDRIAKNASKVYDVYADIGSVTAGTTITLTGKATTRGVSSSVNTTSSATSAVVFTVNTATLSTPTLVSSSPVAQLVVGKTTGNIATFNIKATSGTATINELGFAVSNADIITAITVGGQTKSVTSTSSTKVTGLNITVPNGNAGVDVPVTVTYGTIDSSNGTAAQTTAATTLTLNYVKALSGNNTLEPVVSVASNAMQAVSTKPTVTVSNATDTGMNLTAENKIGVVTVSADNAGNVNLKKLTFAVTNSGFTTAPTALTGVRIADGSTTISNTTCTPTGITSIVCTFTNAYTINAGSSKTFNLYATMTGAANTGTNKAQLSTKLSNSTTDFVWVDVNGSASDMTGVNIYNFPTNSYTVSQ